MSRQRRPGPSRPRPTPAAPAPAVSPADGPTATDTDADELHRLAVARRQARMGTPRTSAAASSTRPNPIPTRTASQVLATSVPVAGMTCRACEVRIERHVGRIPGVTRVSASSARGRVRIESTRPVPQASLDAAIRHAGYEPGDTPWLVRDRSIWLTAGAGILLVAVVAVIAMATGIDRLASQTGDLAQGGVVVALLLGLAAGVSTCMALVGGLVLALSASYQAGRARTGLPDPGVAALLRPSLVFVGGRIAGYGVFGALLGAVGAGLMMPPQLTAALMVGAAIVMTLVGARLTGLSPRVAAWSPTLPPALGRRLGLVDGEVGTYSDARTAGLGALSFFMPCGFTQAVQIYALSTGSPATGGLLLAAFAIGTAPGLLALAGLPAIVPGRARPTILRLVGVAVLAFAFVNAGAGLRLAGVNLLPGTAAPVAAAVTGAPAATGPEAQPAAAAVQELRTFQDLEGYRPANVAIAAGVPTRWTVESVDPRSCASFLVVPDLGIQVILSKGDNVIELPALPAGRLDYTCSMGMYWGTITIAEPAALTGPARG